MLRWLLNRAFNMKTLKQIAKLVDTPAERRAIILVLSVLGIQFPFIAAINSFPVAIDLLTKQRDNARKELIVTSEELAEMEAILKDWIPEIDRVSNES